MLIVKGVRTKMRKLNVLNPILDICCSCTEVVVILRDGHTAINPERLRYVLTFNCKRFSVFWQMALTARKPY